MDLFNDCLAGVFGEENFPTLDLASGSQLEKTAGDELTELTDVDGKIFPATFLKRPELVLSSGTAENLSVSATGAQARKIEVRIYSAQYVVQKL